MRIELSLNYSEFTTIYIQLLLLIATVRFSTGMHFKRLKFKCELNECMRQWSNVVNGGDETLTKFIFFSVIYLLAICAVVYHRLANWNL